MGQFTRTEIRNALRKKVESGKPIVLGGAGTGLIGKILEEADIDIILAYITGVFRMDGKMSSAGALPFSNSTETTISLGRELFRVVAHTPIVCGIGGDDPYHKKERYIDELIDFGYDGVINVPLVGHVPESDGSMGYFHDYLSSINSGFRGEVELIRKCSRKDVFTIAYTFTDDEIRAMVGAGVDVVVPHFGLTGGGTVGSATSQEALIRACDQLEHMFEVATQENPDVFVVSHGGPFTTPEAVQVGYQHSRVHGFIGASSIERLPVEDGVYNALRRLRAIRCR